MGPPLAPPSSAPIFYGWIVVAVAVVTMGRAVAGRVPRGL